MARYRLSIHLVKNYSVNLIDKIIEIPLDNRYTLSYSAPMMTTTETQTTTTLKKGDLAYLFFDWDNRGIFAWYPYIIDSIGSKQIHLRSDDGEMLKRRIYPGASNQHLRAVSEIDSPEATAIEYARVFLIEETARLEQRIATCKVDGFGGERYLRNVTDSLAAIKAATPGQIKKRF